MILNGSAVWAKVNGCWRQGGR